MKRNRFWWLVFGILRIGHVSAQSGGDISFGSWRVHLPYSDCIHLAETHERILAASENGLFSVGKADGEIRRLSAVDGFSDVGVAYMDYQADADVLIIGYRNGNIDLVKDDNRIINLPDVLKSSLQGDKAIRHVHFRGTEAIISTGLGILVLDISKEIFTDSYTSIGPGGSTVAVSATAVVNDTLYAAVSGAILCAPYDGTRNLSDYNNWKLLRSGVNCKNMVSWNNTLVCDLNKVMKQYNKGAWTDFYDGKQDSIANVGIYYGNLYVFTIGRIIKDDGSAKSLISVNLINRGIVDREGYVWFVLNTYGLIKKINGNEVSFFPNGPAFKQSYQMASVGRTLYVTGGGTTNTYGNAFNNNGYAIFHENRWINRGANPITDGLYDWTVAYAEPETKRVFLGTHSFGMVFFSGTEPRLRLDSSNSSLRKFANTIWTRVTGMATDRNGNFWVSNFGSATGLNVLLKTGGWKSYGLLNNNVGQMVIDDYGRKWMLAYNNSGTGPNGPVGLMVYDDNETPELLADDRQRFLNNQADNGGLPSSEVSCLATDRYGYVWVGTDQGLAVFTRPDQVFPNNKPVNAERFVIVEGGTTGYLLGTQVINCITVDGGGRKWVGTNNGAYLVAENGLKVLRHFTKDNSPLLSNEIQSIGIMEETGEVFFGSSEGISSWRGDATPAKDVHGKVKVFPNPVKPGYEGSVMIQGLPEDAEVKITDINGNLVYETRANGGTATWNCRKLNGEKPASGIYLIFSINRDGSDSYMSKLVFIR